MVLKIFVKRKAHGELITDEFEFVEGFSEASEIKKAEHLDTEGNKIFLFSLGNADGEVWRDECRTKTHGFEIVNDKGFVLDRYVSVNLN